MTPLSLGVPILTVITAAIGALSIHWAKSDAHSGRCRSGRILFVVNLLAVGAIGLVAAFIRAQGLPPLGLVAGLLIVGMLWEEPALTRHRAPAPAPLPQDGSSSPQTAG